MIAIKDFKMPVDCQSCFARFGSWCRLDLDERMVVPALPEESVNGFKPDWCPLIEVPDIHVGKCSEIPNNSDCINRQAAIEKLKREFNETDVPDRYPGVFDAIEEWLSECELPSVQPEIVLCKDCRYSEYDFVFNTRYCHNKGKAEMVGDNFFCAAGRSKTNGFDR